MGAYATYKFPEWYSREQDWNKIGVFKEIGLSGERFRCGEAMFQPKVMGLEMKGIHEIVYDVIQKTDPDIHEEMYQNIIVAGGNTMLPGFVERLKKELQMK